MKNTIPLEGKNAPHYYLKSAVVVKKSSDEQLVMLLVKLERALRPFPQFWGK